VAVSALCDVFASTMQCIALNFVSGSVYQMMRGGTIATTFLFTVIYLKQKGHKNQMFGSGFAILGVLIVGAANLIYSVSSDGS
jgi:drug/metabolite transporter (DMT)-like permease